MSIQRTTSTGHVLTLLGGAEEETPEKPNLEEMRETLREAWEAAKAGEVAAVCILAIPSDGFGMRLFSTVDALGDLGILRDELTDVINDARRGE